MTAVKCALRPNADPMTAAVYDDYWRFAAARQEIFFARLAGRPRPWTDDPILARHKFTNAYRAADRTSQYLIRRVIYAPDAAAAPEDVLFRILLFKIFNRIETWELLEETSGGIAWRTRDFAAYDRTLTRAFESGRKIFSAAYIMPSGRAAFGSPRKHRNWLRLLEKMMADGLAAEVARCRRLEDLVGRLRSYPGIGDFLAYQLAIDVNYSELTDFSENEFVLPGPGARAGIAKCFGPDAARDGAAVIRRAAENQAAEFAARGLDFRDLWGRPLQLIDCQNLFCEVGKYARAAHPDCPAADGRGRIKQIYRPGRGLDGVWFPPKWGINGRIPAAMAAAPGR